MFVTGQAGTGKSFLISEVFKVLKRCGEKPVIVCSSGIATSVHDDWVDFSILKTVLTILDCQKLAEIFH